MPPQLNITQLLRLVEEGDEKARQELWSLVYDTLCSIARSRISKGNIKGLLSTRTVVHEAFERLNKYDIGKINNTDHFFSLSARIMRNVLVDALRSHRAQRRGSGERPVAIDTISDHLVSSLSPEKIQESLDVDQALVQLEKYNPRWCRVVECLYYCGFTQKETAEFLEVNVRTVERDWQRVSKWLHHRLSAKEISHKHEEVS